MAKWKLEKGKKKRSKEEKSDEDNITLTINYSIYKRLAQLKLDFNLRTFDDVLEFLLNKKAD